MDVPSGPEVRPTILGKFAQLAHEGVANQSIAEQLSLSRPTVLALRDAFVRDGLAAVTGIRVQALYKRLN